MLSHMMNGSTILAGGIRLRLVPPFRRAPISTMIVDIGSSVRPMNPRVFRHPCTSIRVSVYGELTSTYASSYAKNLLPSYF